MAAAARALHKAGDAFGSANLNNRLHGREVDAKIKAACAHDGFQTPIMQALFHPMANLFADATMVHGHDAGQVGMQFQ